MAREVIPHLPIVLQIRFRRTPGGFVVKEEPHWSPVAGFILSPLVESISWNEAAAFSERSPERRQPIHRFGAGVEQRSAASLGARIARSGRP